MDNSEDLLKKIIQKMDKRQASYKEQVKLAQKLFSIKREISWRVENFKLDLTKEEIKNGIKCCFDEPFDFDKEFILTIEQETDKLKNTTNLFTLKWKFDIESDEVITLDFVVV
jgi:hypothetical protein